jgi:hypothetical protein
MDKKEVDGIKCLICKDEIWSRRVRDVQSCRCHLVSIEGGQRHLMVRGLKEHYEVIKIGVGDSGDSR